MSDLSPGAPSSLRRAAKRKAVANGKPDPLEDMLHALQAMRDGDFSVRLSPVADGVLGEIGQAFNGVVGTLEDMTNEMVRVERV